MCKIQGFDARQASGISGRETAAVSDLGGKFGARCDVEHHPAGFVETLIGDTPRRQISVHQVREIPIELHQPFGQLIAEASEDRAAHPHRTWTR